MKKTNQDLLNNLSKLGFPLLEPDEEFDVNETLAEVVKSHETRLWEGFPIVLANAVESYQFSLVEVERYLPTKTQKDQLHWLVLLSGALYWHYHLSFLWWTKYKKSLSKNDSDRIKKWRNYIAHDKKLIWNDLEIDPNRLKRQFELYYERRVEKDNREKKKFEDFSLEFALSQVFSPKQKDLFKKKLKGLPLSKTEKEYYSRTVKKKVIALANPELHDLARRLLEQ